MKWSGMKKCKSRWERIGEEEEEEDDDENKQYDLKENGGTRVLKTWVPHEQTTEKENGGTQVLKSRVPRGFFSTPLATRVLKTQVLTWTWVLETRDASWLNGFAN